MTLESHKRDWEDLAKVDPLWAIYSDRKRKHRKWEQEPDAFFETGEKDVAELMAMTKRLGLPHGRAAALDFGCGIGRLTRALKKHFERCVGIDISAEMVRRASTENPDCEFIVNGETSLPLPDAAFDLVYTKWVLQHLPTTGHMKSYVAEFVRVLRQDGLLVFQIRTGLSLKAGLQAGRRLYALFRMFGLSERFIYDRLRLNPIRVVTLSEGEMVEFLHTLDVRLLDVQRYVVPSGSGATFFIAKVC